MTASASAPHSALAELDLPIVRLRVTLRLLDDGPLPAYKGAMLRGGLGYAFQRTCCAQPCWGNSASCVVSPPCAYRWIFETPHPPEVAQLHDLRDVPRPFVIVPPNDPRTAYLAGECLEFGMHFMGRGATHLLAFMLAFEELGRMGLGRTHVRARLERAEILAPWQLVGHVIYQDGRAHCDDVSLPQIDGAMIAAHAATLPPDLCLTMRTPLSLKVRGAVLRRFDLGALVRAICWRLNALALFHGGGRWSVDHQRLIEQASAVRVEQVHTEWATYRRTSTRSSEPETMPMDGILGSVVLRALAPELRAVLLAGSLTHVGKGCVFGYGHYTLTPAS
jgi:hypothetical protein